tara:strand:- start:1844 stop:2038 length:195 start_codon:yes stop_codon:yes gene_type:complete
METPINIEWDKLPNKKVQEELLVLGHEHKALKNKLIKLIEHLEEIEKEYYLGNSILTQRYKGEE